MNPDLRAEAELTWRWQHASSEVTCSIRSVQREDIYSGQRKDGTRLNGRLTHPPKSVPTSESGGTTQDVGLRCGPVFVNKPSPPYKEASVEPDYRSLNAMHRASGIDRALAKLPQATQARLFLAFGSRPEVLKIGRWPVGLVALLPSARPLHNASGSTRDLLGWLTRLAGKEPTEASRELELAADEMVAKDARAYVGARFGL